MIDSTAMCDDFTIGAKRPLFLILSLTYSILCILKFRLSNPVEVYSGYERNDAAGLISVHLRSKTHVVYKKNHKSVRCHSRSCKV